MKTTLLQTGRRAVGFSYKSDTVNSNTVNSNPVNLNLDINLKFFFKSAYDIIKH